MRVIHGDLWDQVNRMIAAAIVILAVVAIVAMLLDHPIGKERDMTHYPRQHQLVEHIETLKREVAALKQDVASLERENQRQRLRQYLEALKWEGDLAESGGDDLEPED